MTPAFTIRPATLDDAEIIVAHRRALYAEMGHEDPRELDEMCTAFRLWLRRTMEAREYFGWLAMNQGGAVVSGVGLWLMDWPPHIIGPRVRRARILNVYTEPHSRRMGLASGLLQAALDWCRANGIRAVTLNSTDAGYSLYRSLGFQPRNEMRLLL